LQIFSLKFSTLEGEGKPQDSDSGNHILETVCVTIKMHFYKIGEVILNLRHCDDQKLNYE